MRRKIPSSAALLAFEAAARHGNFARAAAELALTEGAISRQIARLEALLDSKLFDRIGSRVRLNPAGARYARQVREILSRLERETHDVSGMPADGRSLEIAVLPTRQPLAHPPARAVHGAASAYRGQYRRPQRPLYSAGQRI